MSKKILVLSGSARPHSVNDTVFALVTDAVKAHEDAELIAVNVNDLNLPFFNAPVAPSSEDYVATDENVIRWTELVGEADGIILVTPEYNASLSAIQKNAIDWVYKEWNHKPVGLVGYGWHSGERAHVNARAILDNVKAVVVAPATNLGFMRELGADGSIINQELVSSEIAATVAGVIRHEQ
jgi:NAD(P)H-dependent FMN reductase